MIKLYDCDYTKVIEYYDTNVTNIDTDAEITRVRLEKLYNLYFSLDDETRIKYIKHMKERLKERFNIKLPIDDNADEVIKNGVSTINESEDNRFLGEILPILITLEKELLFVSEGITNNNDNIEKWTFHYLNKYDKFKLKKENYDIYDVFDAYATILKKLKFVKAVAAAKVKKILFN